MSLRDEPESIGPRPAVPGEVPVVDVEGLSALLELGSEVTILDVRPAAERADWFIPRSVSFPDYPTLGAGGPGALAALGIRPDVPVVTVCARGRSSLVAARTLRERGIDAHSLTGGMKAWSLAWNLAELGDAGTTILQVRRAGKGCLSYMVASAGEAVVVDPALDPEVYLGLAKGRGWTVRHVVDTHIHADHLSRSRALAAAAGAEQWLPEQQRARFPHRVLGEGARLKIGTATVRALHTPGHTFESSCYLVDERWLLTGDTLFPTSVGRPDLEASAAESLERVRLLHASLSRLLALDPALIVLAGHTGEPVEFDARPIASTLGSARAAIRLPGDAEVFARRVLDRLPATPANHHTIVEFNEAGALPDGDPTDLEAGGNRCAIS